MKKGLVVLAITLGVALGGFAFYLVTHYWGYVGCGGQVNCCQQGSNDGSGYGGYYGRQ